MAIFKAATDLIEKNAIVRPRRRLGLLGEFRITSGLFSF